MPSRGLFALAVIAAITAIACWFTVAARYQTVTTAEQEGRLVFPEFQRQLAKVASIEITRADGQFILARREGTWVNLRIGGFPSLSTRVENAIFNVAGLKYIAPKTRRSKLHRYLEVETVTATAKSTQLTFLDGSGVALADVIIGKPWKNSDRQGLYIRLPRDERTWLVEGTMDVRYDAPDWSNRAVVDFNADTLTKLVVSNAKGEVITLHRAQPQDRKLTLKNLPDGVVVEHQYQVDYIAGLFQKVNFLDAKRANTRDWNVLPAFEAVAHRHHDIVVTLRAGEPMLDGSVWAQIDAQLIDDSRHSILAKQEVDRLQSTFNGWSIRLPRKITDRLKIRLSDIIKPKESEQ